MSKAIAFLALLMFTAPARADHPPTPLVDVAWVKAHSGQPGIVVLDLRNKLGKESRASYEKGHIPGAIYSDYLNDGWRTTVDGVPGQLPPPADLERLIGGLGISNDSHVVLVAGGVSALDMGTATRIYWTFKVLGHDKVSIFDGGHKAYAADPANRLETGWKQPAPAVFEAQFRPELVADSRVVQAALDDGTALVDLRPPAQYRGEKMHKAAKRKGTIPGAVNVPESEVTVGGGRFRGAAGLAQLFKAVGLDGDEDAISFCNTGHWASLGWFARSELLGQKNVKLYDGSMVDWSARAELPMEVKAN